ncbi:MAG: cytochrome c biosis protein transrane region [Verrucomicrobiales bacterium]|nr:cytochrome c biosis protein transrane region [Verrucomicrobiales bacterium]
MRHCLYILLLICCGASTALGQAKTKATLLLSAATAKAGDTIFAGVRLQMPPHWHTYWKNSGDLPGANTQIEWQLPSGVTAGATEWPVPEKSIVSEITAYVYNDEVVLITPLKLADNVSGPLVIKAKVRWTECDKICLQGKAELSADMSVGATTIPSADSGLIDTAQKKLPQKNAAIDAKAFWENAGTPSERPVIIEWSATDSAADFFPFPSDDFEIAGATDIAKTADGKIRLRKVVKKSDDKNPWPTQVSGVLVDKANAANAIGFEVTLPMISGTEIKPSSVPTTVSQPTKAAPPPLSIGVLIGKLFAAFLGGLILNIMPCVLPVIALKIFGFVQQGKESPQNVLKLGLVYTLGVIVSFLLLAMMVILFQKAGGAASWGMQMQYPHYRLALTIVCVLVAANLFGLFEINLSGRTMGAAGNLAGKHGTAGAFFNGVLATALATPCTAPFMAPAVGFAFTQPPHIIILLFLAIALGLATPYLLLSWRPNWLKFLPKPGAWMDKFKTAMGFPMLAAAIWLFSLTAPSFGEDGELGLGLFLLMLAVSLWIWGTFVQRGGTRKVLAGLIAAIILAGGYGYGLEDLMNWRKPAKRNYSAEAASAEISGKIPWKQWSVEAVETARAEGHPVLVDFTAKWCVTCQANKKISIEVNAVRKKLKEINAIAFIGDNTDPDPAIVAELQKHEKAGVPLVLVFPADKNKPPIILPDGLFSAGTMLEALDKAAK